MNITFERAKLYVREHSAELAVFAVVTGISLTIAFLATGDISEAIARTRKR